MGKPNKLQKINNYRVIQSICIFLNGSFGLYLFVFGVSSMSNFSISCGHFDILKANFIILLQGEYSLTYRNSPKKASLGKSKLAIFGIFVDIVLITTGKPNKLENIHKHLKKAKNVSFLWMVVYLL